MGSPPVVQLDGIRTTAARVAASYGLEIFDVQLRRESPGWVLRVIIDRAETVGIEDCQRVSHDLSAILDVEDALALDCAYTLEVSSPGLDRPLRHADDYRRFTGRLAKIVVSDAIDGQKHFAGRIQGIEEETVLLG
ncbi:MAG: ribosome maturation factor RimP, partial [Acidobacteria bacterium]|nr:ribosome maturation factor RimP [Acidobacteriota bacterium]